MQNIQWLTIWNQPPHSNAGALQRVPVNALLRKVVEKKEGAEGGQTAHTQPLSIRSQQVLNVSKRQQDAESLTWEAEPRPRRDPAQTLSSYKELWVSDGDTRSTVCLLDFHLYFSPDVLLFEQHSSACFPRTSFAAVHTHKFNKIVVIKYIQLLSVS